MRVVRYGVAMAVSASSTRAASCKLTHDLHFSSTLHGELRASYLGLHQQVCTQRMSFLCGKREQNYWPQQKPGMILASRDCKQHAGVAYVHLLKPGLMLASQVRKFHAGVAYTHASTYTELGLEDKKKQPSGLQGDDTQVGRNELPTSAYVHLPFCKRRCFYCDFAIVAVGQRNKTNAAHIDLSMDSYVGSLCREITSTLEQLPQLSPLKTLFFGGGTPSLLPARHLSRIIEIFEQSCGLESDAEISMEMDPGTFDRRMMEEFLNCGVNRVSLGVQAFNDDFLKACGRSHGLQDVDEAIDIIHGLGVRNWSLDLISSLPHQTLELWDESLRRAVEVAPTHVSVYDLQIEEGTKFGTWYKPGQHPLPDEDNSAAFYRLASSLLKEAGYEHYEISNYAKPGFQCRHNMVYWKNEPYYGFGLGATSYVYGKRLSRPRKWKEYADFVELCLQQKQDNSNLVKNSVSRAHDVEVMENVIDRLSDTIMLSLRLACGLDLHHISQMFGHDWCVRICKGFVPFIDSSHAVALDANSKVVSPAIFSKVVFQGSTTQVKKYIMFIRLADPEGFLLSNEIISSVFSALPSK